MLEAAAWFLIWLVVGVLATWRLGSMLAFERGPFSIFVGLREWCGVAHTEAGAPEREEGTGDVVLVMASPIRLFDKPLHELGRVLTCVWCNSVWLGLAWALIMAFVRFPFMREEAILIPAVALAISALAIRYDTKLA